MVKTYSFLLIAIFCEVAGTMLLPVSQNFTKFLPTFALAAFYLTAFYLLTFVVNKLPIAIVYATWSGLGIFTIAILGYIFFKQSLIPSIFFVVPRTPLQLIVILFSSLLLNPINFSYHHQLTKGNYHKQEIMTLEEYFIMLLMKKSH